MNAKRILVLMLVLISLVALSASAASAQSSGVTGWFEGEIESLYGKYAVISGLVVKVNKAGLDDDIDRLRVGLGVKVDYNLRDGVFRATYIDDDDDPLDGVGLLSGMITDKNHKRIIVGGAKFKTKFATVEGDADYYVGGRVKVEFYTSNSKLFAYNIDDD